MGVLGVQHGEGSRRQSAVEQGRQDLSVLPKEEQVYPCPQNSREILPVSCVIVVIERIEVFWVWK